MKTPSSECNPSVTITVALSEAMTIWQALDHLSRTHRKTPKKKPLRQPFPPLVPKRPPEPYYSRHPDEVDDGKWGHPDCPPRIQELFKVIKAAILSEQPEQFKVAFGYSPPDYEKARLLDYESESSTKRVCPNCCAEVIVKRSAVRYWPDNVSPPNVTAHWSCPKCKQMTTSFTDDLPADWKTDWPPRSQHWAEYGLPYLLASCAWKNIRPLKWGDVNRPRLATEQSV